MGAFPLEIQGDTMLEQLKVGKGSSTRRYNVPSFGAEFLAV